MGEGRFIEKLGNGSGFFQKWLEVDRFVGKWVGVCRFCRKMGTMGCFPKKMSESGSLFLKNGWEWVAFVKKWVAVGCFY